MTYSYSALNTFQVCPQQFKLKYVDKIKVPKSENLIIGEIVHSILANYVSECKIKKVSTLWERKDEIQDEVLSKYKLDVEDVEKIKENLDNYLSSKEIETDGIIGIEKEVAINEEGIEVDWLAKDVWFRGKMDVVYQKNNTIKIVDYKTGYSLQTDKLQLETYAFLISKIFPKIKNIFVEFDFVNFAWTKEWEIKLDEISKIEKKILFLVEMIENEKEFPAKLSSHCVNCDYWENCEEMRSKKDKTYILESPQALIKEYIRLDKKIAEIKNLLKEHCKEKGEIKYNDVVAGIKAIENWKWNVRELISKCEEKGIDVMDCLNVDKRKITTEIKKRIDLQDIVEQVRKIDITTRFEVK